MTGPNPDSIYPNENIRQVVYIKNVITRPNIVAGDYTYYDDADGAEKVVGNDVWIGQNVTVMPGVHIGDGAIIAANSVVTKDIPPYCIAGGNPCKIIRRRFNEELVEYLLNLKLWDWEADKIFRNMELLCSGDLDKIKHIRD